MAYTSKEDWWQKEPATVPAFPRYVLCPSCKCRERSEDIRNPQLNPGQTPVPMHCSLQSPGRLSTVVTNLQRVPEREGQGTGGFIDGVVSRDASAEHDHVDQGQKTLPVLHLVQEGSGK